MCTAATYQTKNTYFGRNLDYDITYGETAVIIPRNYPFQLREAGLLNNHYAIIGIAFVNNGYPLLYDAINEKGLGMAGLNFAGNAVYHEYVEGKDNIAQFEFIPWMLGRCANVAEAKALLATINLRNLNYSDDLPFADLHWIISDQTGASIVVEAVADGLKIYDNPTGMLTNNPPFNEQLFGLNDYMHLSAAGPHNTFAPSLNLTEYSRGMGGIGLPGDLSSSSRFVKATFTKFNSLPAEDELGSVSQFFHILHSVEQQNGCCNLGDNRYEYTIYSSCYNLNEGIFYYTAYNNHQISAVKMHNTDLNGDTFVTIPIIETEQINYQN